MHQNQEWGDTAMEGGSSRSPGLSVFSAFASSAPTDLHNGLRHQGVTILLQCVMSKNLPFSRGEVKKFVSCRICAELEPQLYRLSEETLMKVIQPMEWLSIVSK